MLVVGEVLKIAEQQSEHGLAARHEHRRNGPSQVRGRAAGEALATEYMYPPVRSRAAWTPPRGFPGKCRRRGKGARRSG